MPEIGEGVFVAVPDVPERPDDDSQVKRKQSVKVRISLYYDGTQNNRANVNARKVATGLSEPKSAEEHARAVKLFGKYGSSGSSYDNDESNVSRIEGQSRDTAAGYDHYFHIYVEGMGTLDHRGDRLFGLGMGVFVTGIVARVDLGITRAVARIKKTLPEGTEISQLDIDTCGFSRGAAAARFAIHRALHGGGLFGPSSLQAKLEQAGMVVKSVSVLAVGLFDTVSSRGLPSQYDSNVKTLKLDAVSQAKTVLQLAAAEEYRENFSLTSIDSAGSKGRNVYLPGSHSDVGGCYEDKAESAELYQGKAARDLSNFLFKRGWYTPLELETDALGEHARPDGKGFVKVARDLVMKEYSYIPLQVMADFLTDQGLTFQPKLKRAFVPRTSKGVGEPPLLGQALVDEITRYAKSKSNSVPSDWEVPREDLNVLRNGYLHASYNTGTGMAIRMLESEGPAGPEYRPYRWVYRG